MSDRMVSYAQNAEDVLLARAFRGQSQGFWVDVGANDPSHDSVTRHFSELGWRGVNVEPQVTYFAALERHRPRDRNLNVGLGAHPGNILFHRVTDAPGMSTFSVSRAAELAGMGYQVDVSEIEVRTLSQLFEDYAADYTVDFLKVDVEGFEQAVLGGFDIERWRPRVLVVESETAVATWESRFMKAGYTRTFWDGFNVYLVRDEDLEALGPPLSRPATVLDAYDPWRYVEAHARVERRLADAYRVELLQLATQQSRLAMQPGTVVRDQLEACQVLADVLAARSDVIEYFGTPLEANLSQLLSWAGTAGLRPTEPKSDVLLPLADMFTNWAGEFDTGDLSRSAAHSCLNLRCEDEPAPRSTPRQSTQIDSMIPGATNAADDPPGVEVRRMHNHLGDDLRLVRGDALSKQGQAEESKRKLDALSCSSAGPLLNAAWKLRERVRGVRWCRPSRPPEDLQQR